MSQQLENILHKPVLMPAMLTAVQSGSAQNESRCILQDRQGLDAQGPLNHAAESIDERSYQAPLIQSYRPSPFSAQPAASDSNAQTAQLSSSTALTAGDSRQKQPDPELGASHSLIALPEALENLLLTGSRCLRSWR